MRFGDSEVLALIAAGVSAWLLFIRSRMPVESNWALIYYLVMVLYNKAAGRFLDSSFIYAGVVCAMLLRFEFLSAGFIKFVRFLESICLLYLTWRCIDYVFLR